MRISVESLERRTLFSGFVSYTAVDVGAGPTDPQPLSSAEAATFDTAAAALGPESLINFENAPVGAYTSLTIAPGVTLTGETNGGLVQSILNADNYPANVSVAGYNTTVGGTQYANVSGGTLVFSFSTPIQFFGAYFSGTQPFVSDAIDFSDGTSETLSIPEGSAGYGGLAFAGFTDAGASITSVTVYAGTNGAYDEMGVDDVRYGGIQIPARLAFAQQPTSSTTVGTLPPIAVNINDAGGNLVGSDDSNVTLSIGSGPSGATLGGTTTVAAINGIATFSNLTLNVAGRYTLIAADTADSTETVATSDNFTTYAPPKSIGLLDPGFGSNGLASHAVGFASTNGLAADGAQSVIIGTVGTAPNESFGVTRYNADGSLDTGFGAGGVVDSSFGSTDDVPAAVAMLANGNILVAGTATTYTNDVASGSEFAVAEYNADGSPDNSFGTNGQVTVGFSGTAGALSNDVLNAMAVAGSGEIYLAGRSDASGTTGFDFAVAALTTAGIVDTGFGGSGKVLKDFSGGDDVINSLALQTNGDVVVAGSATIGGVAAVALARFLPGGTIDSHFGNKGVVTSHVGSVYDSATSVVILPKGQIVIGGVTASGSGASLDSDFVVARYTAAGKIDKTFGGGPVITRFGQPSAVTQLALGSDGDVIASGKTTTSLSDVTPDSLDVAVARYTSRGVLDTSFNNTGKTIIDLGGGTVTVTPSAVSTLGAEFDAFITSQQGVVGTTTGGEILEAGNSGADTVEAELVAAGVELITSLLTAPPASVVAGAKGTASIKVVESGTNFATGKITLELDVAVDSEGDGATSILSVPEQIKLHSQQSKTFKFKFVYPAAVTAGNYYLVAAVDNGSSAALENLDAQQAMSASSQTVDIAPPFIALTGSALSADSKLIPNKTAAVIFAVTNDGNVTAKGTTTVDVYLSPDQTTVDGTSTDLGKLPVNLTAKKGKVFRLHFKLLSEFSTGAYYLIAVIDPTNSLGTNDQTDSIVVDATQVEVAR